MEEYMWYELKNTGPDLAKDVSKLLLRNSMHWLAYGKEMAP